MPSGSVVKAAMKRLTADPLGLVLPLELAEEDPLP